jgi:hypothetical protein
MVERIIKIVSIVGVVAIAYVAGAYWRYKTPPRRPKGVPRIAAYYAGLALPITNQSGVWVNCWFDSVQNVDRCRNTSAHGSVLYEDVYLPYQKTSPMPQSELQIDSEAMNNAQMQFEVHIFPGSRATGLEEVPLVYLKNGDVLIPQSIYAEAEKSLESAKRLKEARATP